jgi:hypothetical protein
VRDKTAGTACINERILNHVTVHFASHQCATATSAHCFFCVRGPLPCIVLSRRTYAWSTRSCARIVGARSPPQRSRAGQSGLLRAKMRRPPTPQKSDGEEHNNPVQAQDQVLQGDQRNFLQYIDEAHFPRGKSRRSSRPSGLSVLDRGLVSSRPVSTLGDRYLGSCGLPSQEHVLFCEALFLLLA